MDDRTLADIRGASEVEVVIDDYGYKGEGYVRLDDGWLSVPGALPGERVRVRVEDADEQRGRRIYGTLVEVLEPSEKRRDPLCERDSICRGCQLRHATIDEELRFHVRTVEEVVEKFAGLHGDERPEVEIITPQPTSRGDAFRIRSTLTYRRVDGDCELGLVSPVSDSLVPMDVCPALTTPVRRLVGTVQEAFGAVEKLPTAADEAGEGEPALAALHVASPVIGRGLVDLELTGVDDAEALEPELRKEPFSALVEALRERLPEDVGLAAHEGDNREHLGGPERIRLPLAGSRLWVGHDDWFAATLAPTDAVYEQLPELLELDDSDHFLDVGSGIGTISILVSPLVERVVGVDVNRRSVATAEINAVDNDATNVEFVVGGWENALRRLTLDDESFSVATINPMREPLGKRPLTYLEPLGVERLVYLGPSPASAAKDIGALREMGWRLDRLFAANVHPATYHVMLVARLWRGP
ncbi:MAG: class I SAM-dependent RNA methyltransferase [Persicimonas sp.]